MDRELRAIEAGPCGTGAPPVHTNCRRTMYLIVWKFRPHRDRLAEFEAAYGPAGAWAKLFAESSGYAGTELLRLAAPEPEYLTIDRWNSHADFERFKAEHAAAYAALDRECETLT